MFTNHGTKCLIILALLVGQRERQLCQAWIHQPNTSRVSRLQAKSKAHNLQRRDVLFQSIHVLMGTSLLIPRSSIAYFDYTDEEIELQEKIDGIILAYKNNWIFDQFQNGKFFTVAEMLSYEFGLFTLSSSSILKCSEIAESAGIL